MSCPPGTILNPRTLRCIRASSRIAQELAQEGVIANYLVAPQRKTLRRPKGPAPCRPDQERNPVTGRCRKARTYRQAKPVYPFGQRRQLSEGRVRHGMGASPDWIRSHCRNQNDALTGAPFAYMSPYELQDIVRLHDRTCVGAQPLHYKVAGDHSAGRMATLPGHSGQPLTQGDLDALRNAMRRRNPAYKIPSRRQQWNPRFY